MGTPVLCEIEEKIDMLSNEEQLLLIEHIAHVLRKTNLEKQVMQDNELNSMALDPEIQNEIRQIDKDFTITESDGLGGV